MKKGDFITSVAIVAIAVLLVLSFIVGVINKKDKDKTEDANNNHELIEVKEGEEGSKEPSSLNGVNQSLGNEVTNNNNGTSNETEIDYNYSYSESELNKGKETAQLFIAHILNYDESQPTKYTTVTEETAKLAFTPFIKVIENMILDENFRNENIYPINSVTKRTVIETSVIESEFYNPAEMYINIKALLNTTYSDGNSVDEEITFNVFLEKALHGEYKVSSIYRF